MKISDCMRIAKISDPFNTIIWPSVTYYSDRTLGFKQDMDFRAVTFLFDFGFKNNILRSDLGK